MDLANIHRAINRCGGVPILPPYQLCQRCLREWQFEEPENNKYKICRRCKKEVVFQGRTSCKGCLEHEATELRRFQEAQNVLHLKNPPGQNKVANTIDETPQKIATVSLCQRASEVQFMLNISEVAEWKMVENRRIMYYKSLNSLRETEAKAFIDLGLDKLHENVQRLSGDYDMERMAQLFRLNYQFKITLDGIRNFDDVYLYNCIYPTIVAIDELLSADSMRKWVKEDRDIAFEDRNETMPRPKVARRHMKLRTKTRILITFLHLMECTPGICGPNPRIGDQPDSSGGIQLKARPVWHLQNWLYLLKQVQQVPFFGNVKDDLRDIRKRIRNYGAVLKEWSMGVELI